MTFAIIRPTNARYNLVFLDGANILSNWIKIASLMQHMAGLYKIIGTFQYYIDLESNSFDMLWVMSANFQKCQTRSHVDIPQMHTSSIWHCRATCDDISNRQDLLIPQYCIRQMFSSSFKLTQANHIKSDQKSGFSNS